MQQSKKLGFSSTHKKPANPSKKSGSLRIIGGNWRGRKLRFNTYQGLRPTLDRTRETLFNWLSPYIHGSHCLDLFAGSGALGFEAASRGANQITLVEQNNKVIQDLKNNCALLSAKNIKIIHKDAQKFLQYNQEKFDLIFLDPPFGKEFISNILKILPSHLSDQGMVYIEQENSNSTSLEQDNWTILKSKQTSAFLYGLYQYTPQ
jgi:16S rRNA (guanine966-N2)-methyltransferase